MPRIAVIGGGITGLSAAHALARGSEHGLSEPLEVVVLEASERLGGKVATERLDGFLVEAGADSFSTRRAGALELVEELGLGGELVAPGGSDGGGRVLVLRKGRLQELPAGLQLVVPTRLGEVFRSRLLSLPGKARVALDLLRRPSGGTDEADEAVAPFLRRHFGAEYLDRIAAPLLAGIHATDPERLSLRAAFPSLAALERRHGSLVRGARRSAAGGPSRVGLARGMGSLVEALARRLDEAGVELATGRPVTRIEARPGSASAPRRVFRIALADGATLEAHGAVLAVPPGGAASLLAPVAPEAAGCLREIPVTSTATLSLGFRRGDVRHPLDALGFLVPADEGRSVGACTFSSTKFPGRAPEGTVLLRAYVGTLPAPDRGGGPAPTRTGELPANDDALVRTALAELRGVLGLAGEPILTRVHRFPAANPQYLVGHRSRVAALEAALEGARDELGLPPLALAGAAYRGLGLPDCIADGRRAAERVLAEL